MASVSQDVFAYKQVVLNHRKIIIDAGTVRLNGFIRAYAWCLLWFKLRKSETFLESQQKS